MGEPCKISDLRELYAQLTHGVSMKKEVANKWKREYATLSKQEKSKLEQEYQTLDNLEKSILAELAEVEKSIQKGYYPSIWENLYTGRPNDALDILIEKASFLKDVLRKKVKSNTSYGRHDY